MKDQDAALQIKINELVAEHSQVSAKIEAILRDLTFLNDTCPEYTDLEKERFKLSKRIWLLKNNWN